MQNHLNCLPGLYFSLLLVAVFSCARLEKADEPIQDNGSVVSMIEDAKIFYGFTPSYDATKTALDSHDKMYWQTEDRIALFQSTTNEKYRFNGDEGSNCSEFVKDDESVTGALFSKNYALYPWAEDVASAEEGIITFALPATQAYAVRSFARNTNPMVAVTANSASNDLRFQNLCGFIQLRLYGDATVRRIRFYGNNNEVLSGIATVMAAYEIAPELVLAGEGGRLITLDCGDGGITLGATPGSYTPIWLVIPPTVFTKGFTFEIERTTGVVSTKSTAKSVSITRNHALPISAFEVESDPEHSYEPWPVEPLPMAVAHRGCWLKEGGEFYINENCPAGVWMAARYGYPAIECDVQYTLDGEMVLMHDGSINRTMRNANDYSPISGTVSVSSHTLEDLRTNYVLASTDPALRTPIPTLQEQLEACRDAGIIPMLHSDIVESYELAHDILGDDFIAFHANEAAVKQARNYSSCLILLDPGGNSAATTISKLENIGGYCGMSTMGYSMLNKNYIKTVKDAGFEVQASIFPAPHEQRALMDGVTIELSDFFWYQTAGRETFAALEKEGLILEKGESFEWTLKAPDYSAVTLELVFFGTLDITLGGRTYTLSHDKVDRPEKFGARLFKSNPNLMLRAIEPTNVKYLKISLYEL